MSAPRSHSSVGKHMVASPSIGSDSDGLLCLLSKRGCSASAAAFGTWTQGSTVPADQRGACCQGGLHSVQSGHPVWRFQPVKFPNYLSLHSSQNRHVLVATALSDCTKWSRSNVLA
jgi:hypothetical protein